MPKTSNVYARVEPELKKQAEAVLNEIGLPMSNAIALFLKQIVLRRGIPFPLVAQPSLPPTLDMMTKEQFEAALEKGYEDVVAGRVRNADMFFNEFERKYGDIPNVLSINR
jgi:addiction module RelB/DinJ family antitoxin